MKNKVRILKYIENSLILLDSVEYISNGCIFVENAPANYGYLDKLLNSHVFENNDTITDMRYMFDNCTSLQGVLDEK